jgi:hypothetical protein
VPARLRLPARPSPPGSGPAAGPGPVVLFLELGRGGVRAAVDQAGRLKAG